MIKLKIDDNKYTVPEVLTISQWSDLMKWDFKEVMNHPRIVHIVTGAPIDRLQLADPESIVLAMSFIVNAMNQRHEPELKKNPETLTFGQWAEMEVYISLGVDRSIVPMMEIIGSPDYTAAEALWTIDTYMQWRMSVYRSYKVLFGLDEPKDSEEEDTDTQSKMNVAKSWYKILVGLAGNDILKLDEVASQPYKKVFNFMANQKEEQLKENAQKLEQRRNYDLQTNRRSL